MKNKILGTLLILLVTFNVSLCQNFKRLSDASGIVLEDFQINQLEEAASGIVELFPDSVQSNFKVYDAGFYLHSESYSGYSFPLAMEELKTIIEPQSEYYLLFGRQSTHSKLNSKIWIDLKLPVPNSLSPCFTEIYRESIVNAIKEKMSNYDVDDDLNFVEKELQLMTDLTLSLDHVINCCDVGLRDGQSCSNCFTPLDNSIEILKSNNYFDLGELVKKLLRVECEIVLSEKDYSNIGSNINISFESPTIDNYSITDVLDDFLGSLSTNINYSIDVNHFDDDILSDEVCFNEESATPLRKRDDESISENIVILDYSDGIKVFLKLDFPFINLVPGDDINLYNFNIDSENTFIPNTFMHPIMDQAYTDASNIFIKNGFNIFNKVIVVDTSQLNAVNMTQRNYFYNFINIRHFCYLGITKMNPSFYNNARDMWKGFNDQNTPCKPYSYINIGRTEFISEFGNTVNSKQYEVGYVLAHELLHALTIRGAKIMELEWGNELYNFVMQGDCGFKSNGHFGGDLNLLTDGYSGFGIPQPIENELNDLERIPEFLKWIMLKSIYKND